ncbi:hypothetical protein ACN27E_10155 [Mycobacterium sp. WMMD1722]|uniref:hypothetical protein n=1 Tax=Mycobacterium sp. WMMD1722 TaxID=3404117 RepID=UPI003BF59172
MTLTDWLTQHVDYLTGVEPGTTRRYRSYLKNDIGPVIGDIPLEHLSRDDIARWMNGPKGKDGGKPSGKTIANKHGFLAGALKRRGDRRPNQGRPMRREPASALGSRGDGVPRPRRIPAAAHRGD